jgi:hypothetical protein
MAYRSTNATMSELVRGSFNTVACICIHCTVIFGATKMSTKIQIIPTKSENLKYLATKTVKLIYHPHPHTYTYIYYPDGTGSATRISHYFDYYCIFAFIYMFDLFEHIYSMTKSESYDPKSYRKEIFSLQTAPHPSPKKGKKAPPPPPPPRGGGGFIAKKF